MYTCLSCGNPTQAFGDYKTYVHCIVGAKKSDNWLIQLVVQCAKHEEHALSMEV